MKFRIISRLTCIKHYFNSFFILSCKESTENVKNVNYRKNPFEKIKKKRYYDNEYDLKIANRISVSVLGNGAVGQPQCLCIFTEYKCYMFNCGEGSLRNTKEHGVTHLHAKHVFITEKSWSKIAGLADVYLTSQTYGNRRMTLHGPPQIESFIDVVQCTMKTIKLFKRSLLDSPYTDDTLEVEYVPFSKKNMKTHKKNVLSQDQSVDNQDYIVSYICKVKPKPPGLNMKKCIEHRVPVGPLLLKLKNGEDVTLPSGEVVHAQDVLEEDKAGFTLLVVDCPYEGLTEAFVNEEKLKIYQTQGAFAVFHFSPSSVVNSYRYQTWINRFPSSTLHVFLNAENSSLSSEAVHELQHVLHMLHPQMFPLLKESPKKPNENICKENFLEGEANLQFHFRPIVMLDRNCVPNITPDKFIQRAFQVPLFKENLLKLHKDIEYVEQNICTERSLEEDPEVIFLGTSSSSSTTYRNVTAILVNLSSDKSILLDCGEGAYMQLVRYFGYENVCSVLLKISCIFISHFHNDHYLGVFNLIKARKEAFRSKGKPYVPVAIATTNMLKPVFKKFHYLFEPILRDIEIFTNDTLIDNGRPDNNILQSFIGNIEFQTVPVTHCVDAYGLVLKGDQWKIVYSGDCAPTQALIDAGQNCDLLIHEASIEDDCLTEASFRLHSTPSQVIDVAEKMNAKNTIMTHFSKRYLVAPIFPEAPGIGYAFDNMRVRLSNLKILPLFTPTLKSLFSELYEEHSERGASVASFEKVLLRNLQNNYR